MKLARFISDDGRHLTGRLTGQHGARPLIGELFGELAFASEEVGISEFLPLVEPPNIFAIGRNYRGHVEETKARLPDQPLIFQKATTALLAHGGTIELPEVAPHEVDFEAELAIVIGRQARNVSEAEALDYVLGFTCGNDVSARDCQRHDKQWGRAKSFDTFCPLGPWLVTPDELDPADRAIRSRLNGQVMQDSRTSRMVFSCQALVSFLSRQFTLRPGTVIMTGTPEGVGFARQPPVFLKAGDLIEIEIEGIGTLSNRVSASTGPAW